MGIDIAFFKDGAYVHPFGKEHEGRIEIYRRPDDGAVEISIRGISAIPHRRLEAYCDAIIKAAEIADGLARMSRAEKATLERGFGWERPSALTVAEDVRKLIAVAAEMRRNRDVADFLHAVVMTVTSPKWKEGARKVRTRKWSKPRKLALIAKPVRLVSIAKRLGIKPGWGLKHA
jgi:hypothetical protein